MRQVASGIGVRFDEQKRQLHRPMGHQFFGEVSRRLMPVRSLRDFARLGEFSSWHQRERQIVSLDGLEDQCRFAGILTDCHQEVDGRIVGTVITKTILHGPFPELQAGTTGQTVYAIWANDTKQALTLEAPGVPIGVVVGRQDGKMLVGMAGLDEQPFKVEVPVHPPTIVPAVPVFSLASATQVINRPRCNIEYWVARGQLVANTDPFGKQYVTREELARFIKEVLGRQVA